VSQSIDELFRSESRRVLATLIRLLGDFDLAEEALQEAFAAAVERWPAEGVPRNPRAWLVSTGRFKAIDGLRRRARFDASLAVVAERLGDGVTPPHELDDEGVEDDRLRLIFTCCHPALPPDAQIALTLREVCGLTTEEIARAFLSPAPTLAQRIVRAKAKIKAAKIPYQIPSRTDLPERLATVLHVIYLVFNEGYAASSGATLTRHDLSAEAILDHVGDPREVLAAPARALALGEGGERVAQDGHVLELRSRHLRGERPLPDQSVHCQLLAVELGGERVGSPQGRRRPNGLVSLLGVLRLRRELSRRARPRQQRGASGPPRR